MRFEEINTPESSLKNSIMGVRTESISVPMRIPFFLMNIVSCIIVTLVTAEQNQIDLNNVVL